jgi:1,4-alpha-glucan branching enzyme
MPFDKELGIPVPNAQTVWMRCSPYPHQQTFDPASWPRFLLTKKNDGWWILDIPASGLADGVYEYEYLVSFPPSFRRDPLQQDPLVVPDPYAEELEKFAGYRGLIYIKGGLRIRPAFSWANELPATVTLPQNNQLVIYELPMRWIDAPDDAMIRQVDLGTFDKAIFERLDYIQNLGCTAIELLPVQDSPDTLNWGYGTRFFYAPDFDMGAPFDLKFFIKSCHQRGIRVILDVVMNHARSCPLRDLAYDWYFGDEAGRNAWGGDLFKYRNQLQPGYFPSRSWQFDMASFWITEYHIDGFRIDEFKGIDNWDFIRDFRNNAWAVQQTAFPGRPFIVIAEDSARRPEVAQNIASGGKVTDTIWDFDFRDEIRQLCSNIIVTDLGKPSRSERVQGIIRGDGLINGNDWRTMWNSSTGQNEKAKFTDLSQRVVYITSHDIEGDDEQRLYPYFLKKFQDKWGVDWSPLAIADSHPLVIEQFYSAFAIMLTTPGIPMFLAGEEFADLHDLPHSDWRQKMSDPINWNRLNIPSHQQILHRIKPLINLRSSEPCLQRNEVSFFGLTNGFHPTFDNNDGERVFAYSRTGGKSIGQTGQVAVIVNAGPTNYTQFLINWPWISTNIQEIGGIQQKLLQISGNQADIELKPFQTRVFTIRQS